MGKDVNIDESALWKGIQRGNQASFEAVYRLYFKLLYRYGKKIGGNSTIVEDAIHDLFFDLWKYRQKISATTSIKFYLFRALRRRIVKNTNDDFDATVFDFRENEIFLKKALSYEDVLIESESHRQRISVLKKHLNSLSPRHYESLILRFYDDFSYKEIAAIMDVNEQSARNIVQRALEHLRHFAKVLYAILFFVLMRIPFSF